MFFFPFGALLCTIFTVCTFCTNRCKPRTETRPEPSFILRHRRRRKIRFDIVIGFFATDAMLVLRDQYDADGRADEHSLGYPGEGTKPMEYLPILFLELILFSNLLSCV